MTDIQRSQLCWEDGPFLHPPLPPTHNAQTHRNCTLWGEQASGLAIFHFFCLNSSEYQKKPGVSNRKSSKTNPVLSSVSLLPLCVNHWVIPEPASIIEETREQSYLRAHGYVWPLAFQHFQKWSKLRSFGEKYTKKQRRKSWESVQEALIFP